MIIFILISQTRQPRFRTVKDLAQVPQLVYPFLHPQPHFGPSLAPSVTHGFIQSLCPWTGP